VPGSSGKASRPAPRKRESRRPAARRRESAKRGSGSGERKLSSSVALSIPAWAIWVAGALIAASAAYGAYWYLFVRPVQQQLAEAERAFEVGNYERAGNVLDTILKGNPGQVEATVQLARTKAATGDSEAAIRLYERAVEAQPKNGPALYELAVLERLIGRSRDAVPHFEAALASDPESKTYLDELVKTYVQAGEATKAADLLAKRASQTSRPKSERKDLYVSLALVSMELRDSDGARMALREALRLAPDDEQAKLLLDKVGD